MSNAEALPLADPALRTDLARVVRRRIASDDVDDIVQAVLTEAITSERLPAEPHDVRRFVFAIARQRIVDWYRAQDRKRRLLVDTDDADAAAPELETTAANDLLEWAEAAVRDAPAEGAPQTFEWILRAGAGETLGEIAASERVAAATVRQRMSRLRRFLRERWSKEATAIGLAGLVAIALAFHFAHGDKAPAPVVVSPPAAAPTYATPLAPSPPVPVPVPAASLPVPAAAPQASARPKPARELRTLPRGSALDHDDPWRDVPTPPPLPSASKAVRPAFDRGDPWADPDDAWSRDRPRE